MDLNLESLGFSKEELQQRVIEALYDRLLDTSFHDDTDIYRRLEKTIIARVDAAVAKIADEHIIPNATKYLETLCLQETNRWGEKTGRKITFVEYLVERAEKYLTEEVNYEGKTKNQSDSYSWKAGGTRVTYLINQHLQWSIETAMRDALSTANKAIIGGLEQAVKIKLQEVANKLKVEVKTR